MPAIISENFRIFNAKQFINSLSSYPLYFFIGRPQPWNTYLEIYNVSGTFTAGETVYVGANLGAATFKVQVVTVLPNSLVVTNVTGGTLPATGPTLGSTLTGNSSAATALCGVYIYATESIPPIPFDNQLEKFTVYDDMIALQSVPSGSIKPIILRWNWDTVANPKYEMWKPNYSALNPTDLSQSQLGTTGSKFYTMNSNYDIFLCLYNGESVENPTGINAVNQPVTNNVGGTYSNNIFTGNDGYIWQYLYTIPTADVLSFVSSDFIPVSYTSSRTDSTGSTAQSFVNGAVQVITTTSNGTDFPVSAASGTYYAPIIGDGYGGIVKIVTASGIVTSVTIQSSGTNYTYGSVPLVSGITTYYNPYAPSGSRTNQSYGLFTDVGLSVSQSVTSTNIPQLKIIIPPQGGYGSDLITQLDAKRIMTDVRLIYSAGGDFPTDITYRRIGLLQSVTAVGGGLLSSSTASALYAIRLSGITGAGYTQNEIISQTVTGGTAYGTVIDWTPDPSVSGVGVLRYFQTKTYNKDTTKIVRPFESSTNTVSGASSLSVGSVVTSYASTFNNQTFVNGLASPDIKQYSGNIVYVENRAEITRAADQVEDIKLVIEF
jgi:hypothetical protein